MRKKIFLITIGLFIVSCAQIRNPTGGSKDITPPVIVKSNPPNKTVNFNKEKEIEIGFNEFIKLNNLNQELIVSPPIVPSPKITSKGKKLNIDLSSCKLEENTTYSINLGEAVVDYNEGNVYKNLTYVLSTGSSIDSLEIKGSLWNVQIGEKPANVSLLLYTDITDTFHLTKPSYLVYSDSFGNYKFSNLPAKVFTVLALSDKNKNKKIDYKEYIGFSSSRIDIRSNISKELENIELFEYKTKTNLILKDTIYGYQNNKYIFNKTLEDVDIKLKQVDSIYTNYSISKDTLIVYPNRFKNEINLYLSDSFYTSIEWDSLSSTPVKNSYTVLNNYDLHENDTLQIILKYPNDSLSINNFSLLNNQNKKIPFDLIKENNFKYGISASFLEDVNYTLVINKSIIHPDSINSVPDSTEIKTLGNNTLGNLICVVTNYSDTIQNKVLVLYKGDNPIQTKKIISKNTYFNYLKPGIYSLKVIEDKNKDGAWTTGSFENKIHPENIIHFKNPIDIKENWDLEVNITL